MADLQFLTLGVGNAFSGLYYSSCLALQAAGQWLLIDCPHPIRKMMREASASANLNLDVGDISAVVLTHLHADHACGLEMFGYFSHYALGRRATVYAHPEVSARLWTGLLSGSMEWSVKQPGEPPVQRFERDFFDVRALDENAAVQFGPFSIQCRKTIHSIPTTALRIRAGGRVLGYSADTAFDPTLIEWLSEADAIVHESGGGGLHTPYQDLVALPADLRSKMRLIHFPDDFDKQASVIEPLEQGKRYAV